VASLRTRFDVRKNALALALERATARGQAILDLTTSNPTRAGIPYDERAIVDALGNRGALVYEPLPFGLPEARAAVATELGVDPARVVLTASTSEAYGYLFKLLCDPGDDVLAPAPSYPLFDHLAQFEAVRLVPFRLAYDGAWHVDLDSVARAIGPRTRAILLVSPNNPTGSYTKRDELARLASFGLPIVSDEVFATYPLSPADERRATTVLEATGGLTFALGGLSKLAALPQIKVGWIVVGGPEAEASAALERLELIADSYLSLSTPAQLALPRLLATRHVAGDAIRARTQRNLEHLRAAVVGTAATVLHVEGGWYATLRLPATKPEEVWVTELVERDGVHLHPGAFFDFADEPHAVVSLLTPHATFDRGIELLLARVDEATR
jgi:aspartate/methionine/tyrosine aminotransferase